MSVAYEMAKKMASQLLIALSPGDVTPDSIREQVEACCAFVSQQMDGDRLDDAQIEQIARELEGQFNAWIGKVRILDNKQGHVSWLPERRSEISWGYWDRYRAYLEGELPPRSVDSLEEVTDTILSRLEDPLRQGPWDRRGLVVGEVQSGKTANYLGLINKAADAGYKLVVVLAGMHNNLRSQTQLRMDEGFVGYSSLPEAGWPLVGVGLINPNPDLRPDSITRCGDKGDFTKEVAKSFSISPDRDRPLLFVIKKNAHVLRHVVNYVRSFADAHDAETGRPRVQNVPILVIDDEADNASVDTGLQPLDDNGQPDPNYDPKKINSLTRQLLHTFDKSAYVGYTATPFANIFINARGRTQQEGEDLFPRSFIVSLPVPSNHMGPEAVFGLRSDADGGADGTDALPLVRYDDDARTWVPDGHDKTLVPRYSKDDPLPPSLHEAIQAFILSGAAKAARGLNNKHHSMLIHVTRFIDVQSVVFAQVKEVVEQMRIRIRYGDSESESSVMAALKDLWERDFVPTFGEVMERLDGSDPLVRPLAWEDVRSFIRPFMEQVELRLINGQAQDALEYTLNKDNGLKVIAVGGDKLSRGLTLEGLTISYFLRASRMYDTLMQMGRWFGYRKGYIDLCRLYVTRTLEVWFEHITDASAELRKEFELMAAMNLTPEVYGLRVKSHPSLLITSQIKMRFGTKLQISFAGRISETVVFDGRRDATRSNFEALQRLISQLGDPDQLMVGSKTVQAGPATCLWSHVTADQVVAFLGEYTTHPLAPRANAKRLAKYITLQSPRGELLNWTVAVISSTSGDASDIAGHKVGLVERHTGGEDNPLVTRLGIKRLISPPDEMIDLGDDQIADALKRTRDDADDPSLTKPDGAHVRFVRHRSRGLLLVYPLSPAQIGDNGHPEDKTTPVIGIAISFPSDSEARTVEYTVNQKYLDEYYGPDD